MAEAEIPEQNSKEGEELDDEVEGWGLEGLCLDCVYVPCLCLIGKIKERIRKLREREEEYHEGRSEESRRLPPLHLDLGHGEEDEEGARLDSTQDQEQDRAQVGTGEGGDQCSMKQEDLPASPPQEHMKAVAGEPCLEGGDKASMRQRSLSVSPPREFSQSGAPGQEGGELLSMKLGVTSASPPSESGSDQGGGEQDSTEQRPSKASPPCHLIRELECEGEGENSYDGEGDGGGADGEQGSHGAEQEQEQHEQEDGGGIR